MGHIIVDNIVVWYEGINGSVNVEQLCQDIVCTEYSNSYRISIAHALNKIKCGLLERKNNKIDKYQSMIDNAIQKIHMDESDDFRQKLLSILSPNFYEDDELYIYKYTNSHPAKSYYLTADS